VARGKGERQAVVAARGSDHAVFELALAHIGKQRHAPTDLERADGEVIFVLHVRVEAEPGAEQGVSIERG
jgi:hypothetical protein